MIDCISGLCCVSNESSSRIIMVTPPIIWLLCSVFLSSLSIRLYTGLKLKLELYQEDNWIIILLLLFGIGGIISAIFTLSNILQAIFELVTSNYALKIQRYGQRIFLLVFIILSIIEVSCYLLLDDPVVDDYIYEHLLKSNIAIAIPIPFMIISYVYDYLHF